MSERERILSEVNDITSDVYAFMCNQNLSIDELLTYIMQRIEEFHFEKETEETMKELLCDQQIESKVKQMIQLILTSHIADKEETNKVGRGWS